jgi:hypothetical protein
MLLETWDLEAALAFGTLEDWWAAVREAFEVPGTVRTHDEWLAWAGAKRVERPLEAVSRKQNWANHAAARALYTALTLAEHDALRGREQAGEIACFHSGGFATRLGDDGWAPTAFVVTPQAWERCYDGYNQGPASIHVEAAPTGLSGAGDDPVLAAFERRLAAYARAGVAEVWLVGTHPTSFRFLRLRGDRYAPAACDAGGVYRTPLLPGIEIHMTSAEGPPCQWYQYDSSLVDLDGASLRLFPRHRHEQPEGLAHWDAIPVDPSPRLDPQPVSWEKFVAWSPRPKFEWYGRRAADERSRLYVDGSGGTRRTLALLVESLGLREAASMAAPARWVRALVAEQEARARDRERKADLWERVLEAARLLRERHGARRVSVAGDLVGDRPLTYWSGVTMIVDEPAARSLLVEDELGRILGDAFFTIWDEATADRIDREAYRQPRCRVP